MKIVFVFLAAFIGSGLKAIGGFGFATLATPAIAIFWDIPTAIAVISVPNVITSFLNGWRTRSALEEGLTPFLPFFFAALGGLGVGLTILFNADPRLLKLALGIFLIGQVVWQWKRKSEAPLPENSRLRSVGMGLVAGAMLGTINMPSHVIASYLTGMQISKQRYLFVMSAIQVVLRAAAVASLVAAGVFTWEVSALTAAVFIPVLLGYLAGSRMYEWFPDRVYLRLVLGLILIMAVSLVVANGESILAR